MVTTLDCKDPAAVSTVGLMNPSGALITDRPSSFQRVMAQNQTMVAYVREVYLEA